MSGVKHDGGPAFPTSAVLPLTGGMSLRDYFAANAMLGELVTAGAVTEAAIALAVAAERDGQTIVERIAFNAYQLADAMLKARA